MKNEITRRLYKELKPKVINLSSTLEIVTIKRNDENNGKDTFIEFYNDALEDSRFKMNLSIPSLPDGEMLGVYLSITIPQFIHSGTLFEVSENGQYKIKDVMDNIGETQYSELTINDVLEIANTYFSIFEVAYKKRHEFVSKLIKHIYSLSSNIDFKTIQVPFIMPVTKDKNYYLYDFNSETKTVFLNDITGSNYKSVTNGIEEIATTIYHTHLREYDPDEITWINIFINLNHLGIVFQKITLTSDFNTIRKRLFYIFHLSEERHFVKYTSPSFDTDKYVHKKDARKIWEDILEEFNFKYLYA